MKFTEIDIDIIKQVETMGLKFPIATITKLTGFGKSQVSQFLNGKLKPSKPFIKKFHEVFLSSPDINDDTEVFKSKIINGKLTADDLINIYRQGEILAEALRKQVANNTEILELLKKHFNQSL